jgi:hypothetical protein
MADFERDAGAWFQAKVDELNRRTFRALQENMKDGEEITQTFIATRGTRKSGKQGRIDTGKMLDSVGSDAKLEGRDEAVGRFGWLDKKPFYAEYQEAGTEYIEPMYALSDAADIVKLQLIKDISDNVKDA